MRTGPPRLWAAPWAHARGHCPPSPAGGSSGVSSRFIGFSRACATTEPSDPSLRRCPPAGAQSLDGPAHGSGPRSSYVISLTYLALIPWEDDPDLQVPQLQPGAAVHPELVEQPQGLSRAVPARRQQVGAIDLGLHKAAPMAWLPLHPDACVAGCADALHKHACGQAGLKRLS